MSNCHLVAGRSLIDLVASRLALRAPALRAATALTRPNRSAQRLPCGRRAAPTAVTVDPSRTNGRSDWSSKLTRGFGSEAPAGFRSRRGDGHDRTPIAPQNAPFPTYKAPRVHRPARLRGCVAHAGALSSSKTRHSEPIGDTGTKVTPHQGCSMKGKFTAILLMSPPAFSLGE